MKYSLLFIMMFVCCSLFSATEQTEPVITKDEGKITIDENGKASVPVNLTDGTVVITSVKPGKKCFKVIVVTVQSEDEDNIEAIQKSIGELQDALKAFKKKKEKEKAPKETKVETLPSDGRDYNYNDRTKEPNRYITQSQARFHGNVSEPYVKEEELENCHLDNGSLV